MQRQGHENERFFAMQADLEKQFSVLAAQLEGPVSEFVAEAEHDAQVMHQPILGPQSDPLAYVEKGPRRRTRIAPLSR